jgi:ABC-type transport system involved in cytochrome bd biosynthesis fused ATPase/permease subunit
MARSFLARLLPIVAVLVGGAVLLLVGGDAKLVGAVGLAAIGVALVLLVSLLFYEVGRSEDRAREREQEQRRPPR